MMKRTRDDWLQEGVRILAEMGPTALTIDLLLTRLDMTKGSFYYHFKGYRGYVRALLDHIERTSVMRVSDLVDGQTDAAGQVKAILGWVANHNPALEAAMRSWAYYDDDASTVQVRLDRERLHDISVICTAYLGDSKRGQGMANLLFALMVGRQQAQPPLNINALLAEFQLLYDLVN